MTTGEKRPPTGLEVREIPATATYAVRRLVLRDGRPDAEVRFPQDKMAETFHLAVLDGDEVVGVGTFSHEATPRRPGRDAWRLRGMAIVPRLQGSGAGSRLLDAGTERVRAAGAEVLWADGRDAALAFYRRRGWVVEGEGYATETGIPHHFVALDLG